MNMPLFALPSDAYAVTSDDCYTPRWVFDAMGLDFDLDVAAPPGGPWHVPAGRWYTAEDDGLAQPWDGLVWCNPPYSNFVPWAELWASSPAAVLMGSWMKARWNRLVTESAEAVTFLSSIEFAAVRTVAAPDGRVDPNALTTAVRGVVAPKRCGAFCNRALRSGLLVWRGEYVTSTDAAGRNSGRPIRCYYLSGDQP